MSTTHRAPDTAVGELWLWALAHEVHYTVQAKRAEADGNPRAATLARAKLGVVRKVIEVLEGER